MITARTTEAAPNSTAHLGPEAEIIQGFGFTGYRSVWSKETQVIGPLNSQVHIIAGLNNSGKSNVLRFTKNQIAPLTRGYSEFPSPPNPDHTHWDNPVVTEWTRERKISLGISPTMETALELAPNLNHKSERHRDAMLHLMRLEAFKRKGHSLSWFDFRITSQGLEIDADQINTALGQYYNSSFDKKNGDLLTTIGLSKGIKTWNVNDDLTALTEILQDMNLPPRFPPVEIIDALRQITSDSIETHHNGAGIIQKLATLQNPINHADKQLKQFEEIQNFVRRVLEDENASIHIPFTHDEILINSRGRVLPLANLGTGVQQVLIIAMAATVIEGSLVCIEEPEVHLHPTYQRRLIEYLANHTTSNRYIISTHSAHILNTNIASISHVTLDKQGTSINPAVSVEQLGRIANDLGCLASDILQSNCVIWVEGPSDRTYINHWIQLIDNRLTEGMHYSVMFYGGKLLSHLTTKDFAADSAISLMKLNRNMAIVIDSDATSIGQKLNATKTRIIDELKDHPTNFSWTTAGYTIENYVPHSVLSVELGNIYPGNKFSWKGSENTNPLKSTNFSPEIRPDKIRIAEQAIKNWDKNTSWPMDLRNRVDELVEFIHAANGLHLHHD